MAESCISCDRDTGAGTSLFAGRKRGIDRQSGAEGWLCPACQPESAETIADQSTPLSGRYVVVDLPGGGPGFSGAG